MKGMHAKEILDKLEIRYVKNPKEAFDTLTSSLAIILKAVGNLDGDAFKGLKNFHISNLNTSERLLLEERARKKLSLVNESFVHNLQERVQKMLSPLERKRMAAYYTKPLGLEIASRAVERFMDEYACKGGVILSDPFLGSGLMLVSALKVMNAGEFALVWGVEPHPLVALVAYSSLLYFLDGDVGKVGVFVGDVFRLASSIGRDAGWAADVILTNPPFTRWEILDANYRRFLTSLVRRLGYGRYVVRGQLNLQLVSIFLMDYILRDGGLLVSVLPASTLYITSGEGVKRLLREGYRVLGLVEAPSEVSFSMDSGFKELMVVCVKGRPEGRYSTAFISVNDIEDAASAVDILFKKEQAMEHPITNYVDLMDVPSMWDANWLVLFGRNELREFLSKVLLEAAERGTVGPWVSVYGRDSLVRGVEMYGPDFFLIPNRYWAVADELSEGALIKGVDGEELVIGWEFLEPALRRPGLYKDRVLVEPSHYLLVVPPVGLGELPGGLRRYIGWGVGFGVVEPAVRAFGGRWYSHVYRQVRVKAPYGRVFLPDKVDLRFRGRSVYACYTERPVVATKNFHIVTLRDERLCKALAAWFNSTVFLALFVVAGRRISGTWTRFLEEDYLRLPTINLRAVDEDLLDEVCRSVEALFSVRLPPLPRQLGEDYRLRLDVSLAKAMGLKDPEGTVYKLHRLFAGFFSSGS